MEDGRGVHRDLFRRLEEMKQFKVVEGRIILK
jgi:hypothetical protein